MPSINIISKTDKPAVLSAHLAQHRDASTGQPIFYMLVVNCRERNVYYKPYGDRLEVVSPEDDLLAVVEINDMTGSWLRTDWIEKDQIYIHFTSTQAAAKMEVVASCEAATDKPAAPALWKAGSPDDIRRGVHSLGPDADREAVQAGMDDNDILVGIDTNGRNLVMLQKVGDTLQAWSA